MAQIIPCSSTPSRSKNDMMSEKKNNRISPGARAARQSNKNLMQMDAQFDELLLQTIHKTLRSTCGRTTTEMIYKQLKEKSCPKSEIPRKLSVFHSELRNILEIQASSRVGVHKDITILGTITILEKAIAKRLCKKLGVEFNELGPIEFPDYIEKIKKVYYHSKNTNNPHNV